ncbi:JAB domain-containing protein, partial [Escherichia coli]|uniref:JAB domain-containing protein n=1 Tax=Escherichia coli TaxID=562 RepID=UPI0025907917
PPPPRAAQPPAPYPTARTPLLSRMIRRHRRMCTRVSSKADRLITDRLVQALGLVDIRVPDHLIVGGNPVFSCAEHGLL